MHTVYFIFSKVFFEWISCNPSWIVKVKRCKKEERERERDESQYEIKEASHTISEHEKNNNNSEIKKTKSGVHLPNTIQEEAAKYGAKWYDETNDNIC